MPRPKPSEPWVNIALRLTPAQAAKVQAIADQRGLTVSTVIRTMIEHHYEDDRRFDENLSHLKTIQKAGKDAADALAALGRPKAKPGSLLKKR